MKKGAPTDRGSRSGGLASAARFAGSLPRAASLYKGWRCWWGVHLTTPQPRECGVGANFLVAQSSSLRGSVRGSSTVPHGLAAPRRAPVQAGRVLQRRASPGYPTPIQLSRLTSSFGPRTQLREQQGKRMEGKLSWGSLLLGTRLGAYQLGCALFHGCCAVPPVPTPPHAPIWATEEHRKQQQISLKTAPRRPGSSTARAPFFWEAIPASVSNQYPVPALQGPT